MKQSYFAPKSSHICHISNNFQIFHICFDEPAHSGGAGPASRADQMDTHLNLQRGINQGTPKAPTNTSDRHRKALHMASRSPRKLLTRRVAVVGATVALAAGVVAPAAHSQNIGDLIGGVGLIGELSNAAIENMDCDTLDWGLNTFGLVDEDTTRSELAKTLRELPLELGATDPAVLIFGKGEADKWADKALECGIVKEDPQTPLAGSMELLGSLEFLGQIAEAQNKD